MKKKIKEGGYLSSNEYRWKTQIEITFFNDIEF